MANLIFPSELTRTVLGVGSVGTPLTSVAGQTATIYTDAAATTTARIYDLSNVEILTHQVTIDSNGRLPFFHGPDTTTTTLYVKVGTGPVQPLLARCGGADDPNAVIIYAASVGGFASSFVPQSVTGTGGDTATYTLQLQGAGVSGSGTKGLVLSRSAAGFPLGLTLQTGATRSWDIGLDASTPELVLANSAKTGMADCIRGNQDSAWIIGSAVGSPGFNARLQLVEQATQDLGKGFVQLLRLQLDHAGDMASFLQLNEGGTGGVGDCFQVLRSGKTGIGGNVQGFTGAAYAEVKTALTIWNSAASTDPFLYLTQTNGAAAAAWIVGIDYASGKWYVKNNGTGHYVIQSTPDALDSSFVANTFGSVVGAATAQVGFFGGASMAVKQTITGSRGSNAALTSLLTALAAHGLIVNSTTA